jgi:hypothetical protein
MPKKLTGDFAQISVGSSVFTASTTTGSPTLSDIAFTGVFANGAITALLSVGQAVSGAGIPANTTIQSISGTTVTLTNNATATASVDAVTAAELQVLGLSEWTIDWKRKTVDGTTTDDNASETSLGSTSSWTVKAKHMYYDGDPSQQQVILAAIQTPQGASKWNFFPDVQNSDVCWDGLAYIDGITIGAGVGKSIGIDVSLKGTGPLNQAAEVAPIANTATLTGQQAED